MISHRQPISLYITALVLFGLSCLVPVVYMLGQFFVSLVSRPPIITNVLIDSRQLILLVRSLAIAVGASGVALVIGLPVAIILSARDLPFRKVLYFSILVPLLIPPYVMAGAWIHLLSPTGLFNRLLVEVFGSSTSLVLHSPAGCVWCLGISFFPLAAVIVAAGLSEIDRNLIDVARLSTGRWGIFRYAILPQIWPHLIASVCLVMIFVLAQYGVPSLLGVNTYPVEIFAQFSAFYDDTAAVGTAVPLIVMVIFLVLLQRWMMRNYDYVRVTPSSEAGSPIKLKGSKYCAVVFLIVVLLITTVLPFASVVAYVRSFAKVWGTLWSFSDAIITTSLLALLAAVISTVVAFPIGYLLAYSRSRFIRVLDIICWLPIAIPGTIIGLGLIRMNNLLSLFRGIDSFCIPLLAAYIGIFSAFSIRIFHAASKRIDPNIDDAAAIDCRRWYQRLFYIDIPVYSRSIIASIVIVFVLVLGELNATVLLIPPGKATLSVTIDNLLHYGANVQASILCLIEAVFVVLVAGVGVLIWHFAEGTQK